MTTAEIGIHLDSPFYNLPVLVYAEIFGYLNASSIGACRLVCSQWYTMYLRLYSRPNGYCIRTGRWWNTVRKLEKNLTICLETKDTEITFGNLKLENVDIADCVNLLEKSSDFREIVNNVTSLTLADAFFRNCETLVKFLNKFKKLKKLALRNGSFSVLEDVCVVHWMKSSMTLHFPDILELPESLESIFIEVRQDCAAIPLLFEILAAKSKNLKEYHLTVIPCSEGLIQKVARVYLLPLRRFITSSFQRSTFCLCYGFAQLLKRNSSTLKSLYIDWKMNGSVFDNRTLFGYTTRAFREFMAAFQPFLTEDNNLRLTELSLLLGNTQISFIHHRIRQILLPFVALQIQRELRKTTIGNIQDLYPFEGTPFWGVYERIFDTFPQLEDEEYFSQFSKDMKMDLCLEVFMHGSKFIAERYVTWMRNKYSLLFLRELGITINRNTFGVGNDTEELSEWMPKHKETDEFNPNVEIQRTFSRLQKLKIHVELNNLKAFNICTVTHICPFLSVLEIVDGKLSLHQTNMVQREDMSLAAFKDSDFRFIITKLKNLQYITVWANLESISDFALTGCPQESCMAGAFGDGENINNNFMKNANEALEKEIQIKNDNPDYGKIIQSLRESSIAELRRLKKLSLRGVGGSITDKIISSLVMENGYRRIDELETLEILGSHRISKTGKRTIKKAIKEVLL